MTNIKNELAKKIYAALLDIPRGKVASYKELAVRTDCGSPRVIGSLLAKNPNAPRVPCHRVIRSDGKIGGYAGKTNTQALEKKRTLLESEGVFFDENACLVDKKQFFLFPPTGHK